LVIVYFDYYYWKYSSCPNLGYFFPTVKVICLFWQKRVGSHFGRFFNYVTHLVTLGLAFFFIFLGQCLYSSKITLTNAF
jgi:hypothetical protein